MVILFTALTFVCRVGTCTCVLPPEQPRTVAEARAALDSKDVLFEGHVLTIERRQDSVMVGTRTWTVRVIVARMAVRRVWKGDVPDTIVVETAEETTMCGAELERGKQYLVDAYRDAAGKLGTGKCGWTQPFGQARSLRRLLRDAQRLSVPAP
jgi:hypothetical protein